MTSKGLSLSRIRGLVAKEFIQLKRDRLTFAMLAAIPLMQLLLFGYAINADPKGLPTAVIEAESSVFTRSYLKALENTEYFEITHKALTEAEADYLMKAGDILFIINIPADFERKLIRGERPQILIESDATDPIASGGALGVAQQALNKSLRHDLKGPLAYLMPEEGPVELRVHRRFNPETVTQYNTVPGLIGVIMTMTLVMIMSSTMARERERGTLENLYAMPLRPLEVMIGKLIPFIIGASLQAIIVLGLAKLMFDIPLLGHFTLLSACIVLFIVTNLAIGFTFSTVAKTQIQAMQMSTFFFLPSILLSGFMFPFKGMPEWAQIIGEGLPITHFLRIIRGILIKDTSVEIVMTHVWPLLIILTIVSTLALIRYKATLD
jgi:ABC-2 type transport system permease protein